MTTLYSLDSAIESFFSENTTVIRSECDDFALTIVGGRVNPVQIQGAFSYTFTAGTNESKLFQFRTHDSKLAMSIINLARLVHPEFVARCKYHGTIGQSRPLHIYEMDKLPGITYIMARHVSVVQPLDAVLRQRKTAADFARFFAQSWNHGQTLGPKETQTVFAEFRDRFNALSQSLPFRFAPNIARVCKELPLLFSDKRPFVLSHQDLCEMNILVHPDTRSITGIVDWAEARLLPFGFSLWGFENILGYMDSERWHYYNNRHELERIFWQTLQAEAKDMTNDDLQLIRVARMAGLFCRYGFVMDGKVWKGVVDESDSSSLAYLDAFCISDDWILVR
ncbi:hypothetical protein F5Y07DRAFT_147401 [Xylaria sp. FL0933]|nr:hypothetical protein F5Y07DRAFT_147401 [Xylaria sp. FL0933]